MPDRYNHLKSVVDVVDDGFEESVTSTKLTLTRARDRDGEPKVAEHADAWRSPAMQEVAAEIERLRDADCPVLIQGETGTGKTLLARRLHEQSSRASGPFIDVNCGGLGRELVESELFGHERGSFTGAHAAKQGLFEAAHGGSLLLDEIGDIDLSVQPMILKVLEERRFRRVGEVRERFADVRLIAATHHDLLTAVERRSFRADLYYRISAMTIRMPSLRERIPDLEPLTSSLLATLTPRHITIASSTWDKLASYRWPGNVRELRNVLQRALLRCKSGVILPEDLRFDGEGRLSAPRSISGVGIHPTPRRTTSSHAPPPTPPHSSSPVTSPAATPPITSSSNVPIRPIAGARPLTLEALERQHIEEALVASGGRVSEAARRLGLPRSTLYHKIKSHRIELPFRHE